MCRCHMWSYIWSQWCREVWWLQTSYVWSHQHPTFRHVVKYINLHEAKLVFGSWVSKDTPYIRLSHPDEPTYPGHQLFKMGISIYGPGLQLYWGGSQITWPASLWTPPPTSCQCRSSCGGEWSAWNLPPRGSHRWKNRWPVHQVHRQWFGEANKSRVWWQGIYHKISRLLPAYPIREDKQSDVCVGFPRYRCLGLDNETSISNFDFCIRQPHITHGCSNHHPPVCDTHSISGSIPDKPILFHCRYTGCNFADGNLASAFEFFHDEHACNEFCLFYGLDPPAKPQYMPTSSPPYSPSGLPKHDIDITNLYSNLQVSNQPQSLTRQENTSIQSSRATASWLAGRLLS